MQFFQLILLLLFIVIGLVFIYDSIKAFKDSKDRTSSLKTASKYFILTILIVTIPVFILNQFGKEPILNSTEEKIEFYTQYEYFASLNTLYEALVKKDKVDYELHFKYIDALEKYINKKNNHNKFDFVAFKNSDKHQRIIKLYSNNFQSNEKLKNISNLFLALHFTNIQDIEEAENYLDKVKTTEVPYYNYIKGKFLSRKKDYNILEEAEKHLLKARKENLGKEAATKELAHLYYFYRQEEKLKELIYNDEIVANMPLVYLKRIVYFRNFDFKNYWGNIFSQKRISSSWLGFFSSLFILVIWLRYIRKLDIFEPEPWLHTLFVFGLSMITIFLVYPYGDILHDVFGYFSSLNPIKALLHDIVKIGFIEELVKFIPFLIILKLTKAVNEPYDYIYYMSVSALGFAFVENLGYIQDGSLNNISSRGIMPAVAHMLFSATIGYGLMLAKYKKYNSLLMFLVFFVLAAVMHGFYDYWLINKIVTGYEWVSVLFFIVMVHVWHIYVNNTLNISNFYNKYIKIENDNIRYEILLSLLLLSMISYLFIGFALGKENAINSLKYTIVLYGYLIIYLAYSMSRFEVIRGYLKPFTIPLGFLIPKLKKQKSNTGIALRLSSSGHKSLKEFEKIKELLPIYGLLERRLVLAYDLECYVMVLENPFEFEDFYCEAIAIRPKSLNKTLDADKKILASILLIKSKEVLDKAFLEEKDLSFIGYAVSEKIGRV